MKLEGCGCGVVSTARIVGGSWDGGATIGGGGNPFPSTSDSFVLDRWVRVEGAAPPPGAGTERSGPAAADARAGSVGDGGGTWAVGGVARARAVCEDR